ncbi:MAG: PTS ascorbate transporter subunit IIC, partial [Promicromonosporaceae bacterium]|nr:PTS ascorbate transporter subunit IIC [Promicromonosporaceae bacterium]
MDWLVNILNFIGNEFLGVPAYLIGIITAIGLMALRRPAGRVIGGGLKATMGFLILGAGAGVVVGALEPLGALIFSVTEMEGVIPNNEAISAMATGEFGTSAAYTLVLGFIVMLLLARFTRMKYIFLTGHHMVFMSLMLVVVLTVGFNGDHTWLVVLLGALLLGVIMVVMPALAQPWMRKITGDDSVAMGHFSTLGYVAAGATGQAVGKKSKSTEDIKFPQGLAFLRDSMVATALSMVLIYWVFVIWGVIADSETTKAVLGVDGGAGEAIMAGFHQALLFGVGVAIILFGVRTILGELVPAFQGIGEKVVPGAKPALDCPIVFPYAPNAVLVGFLSSFVGGLAMLGLLAWWLGPWLGLALILPGMVPHFFTGATAGVFGNATGGRLGAMIGGFINGVLITILPALLLQVFGNFPDLAGSTYGDTDFGWFGALIGLSVRAPIVVGVILCLVIAAVLVVGGLWWQKTRVDTGWVPGGG